MCAYFNYDGSVVCKVKSYRISRSSLIDSNIVRDCVCFACNLNKYKRRHRFVWRVRTSMRTFTVNTGNDAHFMYVIVSFCGWFICARPILCLTSNPLWNCIYPLNRKRNTNVENTNVNMIVVFLFVRILHIHSSVNGNLAIQKRQHETKYVSQMKRETRFKTIYPRNPNMPKQQLISVNTVLCYAHKPCASLKQRPSISPVPCAQYHHHHYTSSLLLLLSLQYV